MSKEVESDRNCQDVEVNELFKKGLEYNVLFNNPACPGSVCSPPKSALEYWEISEKDAVVLRRLLSTSPSLRKLCVWNMPFSAFKIAFEDLEECSSLEELHLRAIECGEQDFGVKLCGVFSNLSLLDLHCGNVETAAASNIATYLRGNKKLKEFSLWYSCGGDEGAAALIEALKLNDTLKRFTLAQVKLSSETMIAFAELLTVNSTLECVDIFDACFVEDDETAASLEKYCNAGVFKRFRIVWTEKLLPLLTRLVREKACWPELSVSVTASVNRDVLREFFDAVASDTSVTMLHFYPSDDAFDELADGIASVVKRTTTLKRVQNLMFVKTGNEYQLVKVLDALKENRSVTSFDMFVDVLTPGVATSLSELLAVNDVLNEVAVCQYWGITADILGTILRGLRKNYVVTKLMVSWDPDDDVEGVPEMEELLKRNVHLHEKAAEFVRAGGDAESDAEGADALKKVRTSANLVERVRGLTGKTSEAARELIQAAVSRLSG
uniref:Protein nlrc3 n=1 Tax=Rhipicephalus appendiculatus TaxID=34631 RepID=A0A131YJR4_RHIAP